MRMNIARITVHSASEQDYSRLHDLMATINFDRFIVGTDGQRYRLPDGTYVCHSNDSVEILRDKIRHIIDRAVPHCMAPLIFVARFDAATWSLFVDPSAPEAPRQLSSYFI